MPLLSSSAGLSARSLGLTSGVIAGAPTINSIVETGNSTVGEMLLVNITPGRPGSSPVTNYQYSVNNGSTWISFSPAQTSTQLTISSLTNGTTYQVRIRSLQGNQTSEQSNMVSARPVALPSAPTISSISNDVNGTTGGHISVAFSAGSAGTDATANYQYSLDNGTTWASPSPAVTTSPLLITSLTNGTTYSVRLRALTSNNHNSSSSSAVSARPVALPAAPTISSITASTGQISIAFTAGTQGTDAIGTYQYSLNNGSTWTNRSSGTTASPIVVTGISDSTVVSGGYTVRIRAVTNQLHTSAQSNAVIPAATPAAAPVITSTSKTPTSITVNFTSAVAGSYAIDRHERSLDGINWSTYTTGTAITGLSTSTAYTIRIRAVDVRGVVGAQSSTSVTTDAEVAPNAPTYGITVELSTTSIRVNYTRGTQGTYAINNDERQIWYYLNGWVLHSDWTTVTSPFDVTGLPYVDFPYLVRMRSKSTTGLASADTDITVYTRAPVPSATILSFSSTNASERATASLSWEARSYATKYHVYMNNVYQKEVTGTSTTVSVSAGNTYYFNVYAGNRHGEFSAASGTKTMVTGATGVAFSRSDTREILMAGQGSCSSPNQTRLRIGFDETVPDSPSTAGYISLTSISHEVKQTYEGAIRYTQSDDGTRKYYFFSTTANPGGWSYSCNLHVKAIPRQSITTAYETISTPISVAGSALSQKEFFVGVLACEQSGWNIYSGGCTEANVTGFAAATHRIYNLVVSGTQTTATTYS